MKQLQILRLDPDLIGDDDDLYDAGLRSLSAVRLMVALEVEYGIEFPESVLHRGVFGTIRSIVETIGVVLATRPASPAERW